MVPKFFGKMRGPYKLFSLMRPVSNIQIYWSKTKFSYNKRVQLPWIGLGQQHGRHFIVWNTSMAAMTSCENALFAG